MVFVMRVLLGVTLLLCSIAASAQSDSIQNVSVIQVQNPKTSPTIVIGFVGGFVKHDDKSHIEVQLAERLRKSYPSTTYVRTFENHHRDRAYREILRLLDTDHNKALSLEERHHARIIIYGHSWGGSETITLARQLEKQGIPVLLTVQVDSVNKPGQKDGIVPSNVAEAINYYQPDGFLHGRPEIRAADPQATRILGNLRMDYKAHSTACNLCRWYANPFMKAHLQIECDPAVWNQVESLIRFQLDPLVARSNL